MLMIQRMKAMVQNEKGQGMVEYGLILALVAVVAVVALTAMGGSISDILDTVKTKLGGA